MALKRGIYKCLRCGNIVEVLHEGAGKLVCCGQEMTLIEPKKADVTLEKHVPFVEQANGGFLIKVGKEIAHPMEENHYIEWIELMAGSKVYRQELKPGDKPEAFFSVEAKEVIAREYCNLHGLWESSK